jgi:hypothetical protein
VCVELHGLFNSTVYLLQFSTRSLCSALHVHPLPSQSKRSNPAVVRCHPAACCQVIKVDDCCYVKVISRSIDDLLMLSHWYFSGRSACSACRAPLGGGPAAQCSACEVAQYCSGQCMQQHQQEHGQHCALCKELMDVINVDMDRFIQPVPFR